MATSQDVTKLLEADEADVDRVSKGVPRHLEIVPYNTAWPSRFASIERLIRAALPNPATILLIQHVGSTAVPGLPAKEVIDIDLAVPDPTDEAAYIPHLENAGFRLILREPKWYDHRFFHLVPGEDNVGGGEHVNLHVFAADCPEIVRHRLFRDWLREHPDDCERYAEAKTKAAEDANRKGEDDVNLYNARKERVVREMLGRIFKANGFIGADE